MVKRHRHHTQPIMRRSARVYLNELNDGKRATITEFLRLCHDATQFFADMFWQRKDFSASLANLETVHRGRNRFGITTRLAQALAKQAKEIVRGRREQPKRKPRLWHHTVTLYSHFVSIEPFKGSFDWAVKLIGSGAPRMVIPVKSTKPINCLLSSGWKMSKTIRLGRNGNRLWVDFLFEKPTTEKKNVGAVVGMDSNYKAGFVLSNGQVVGQSIYDRIQSFSKRQNHTHHEVASMLGHAVRQIDMSGIKTICIENLKNVKRGTRRKFRRSFNRRLSHWLYGLCCDLLERRCEEAGVRLERKNPAYTSQFCRRCGKWERRNRVGDKFKCVHCGHSDQADHNAAKNLALLGTAGVYGLRSLPSQ